MRPHDAPVVQRQTYVVKDIKPPINKYRTGKDMGKRLTLGEWSRASEYEVRGGYIQPVEGATFDRYDLASEIKKAISSGMSRTPHLELFSVVGNEPSETIQVKIGSKWIDLPKAKWDLRTPFSSLDSHMRKEVSDAVCAWCNRWGLLGLLLHQVRRVQFAPRRNKKNRQEKWGMPIYHFQPRGQLIVDWLPLSTREARRRQGRVFLNRIGDASLGPIGWREEPLSGEDEHGILYEWGKYFPSIAMSKMDKYPYPRPYTDNFWRLYAEPLDDFLRVALLLLSVEHTLKNDPGGGLELLRESYFIDNPKAYEDGPKKKWSRSEHHFAWSAEQAITYLDMLLSATSLTVEPAEGGWLELGWWTGSLLGPIARLVVDDLVDTSRNFFACEFCGGWATSARRETRFCGDSCKRKMEQRRRREWKANAKRYAEYKYFKKSVVVPVDYIDQSGFALGKWIQEQRELGRVGKLSPERVAKLEDIDPHFFDNPQPSSRSKGTRTKKRAKRKSKAALKPKAKRTVNSRRKRK